MTQHDAEKMFNRYAALGDSMSIDLYPSLDLGYAEIPIGAAALLHTNQDATWPEIRGNDDNLRRSVRSQVRGFASRGSQAAAILGRWC